MKWMIGLALVIAAMMSADPAGDDPSKGAAVEMAAEGPGDAPTLEHAAPSAAQVAVRNHTTGVIGGPHDFSRATGGQTNACAACHIPHLQRVRVATPGANATSNGPQPQGDEVFLKLYRIEGQRKTFEPDRYTPGPTSLICLGCHDGTLAESTIGSAHAMLAGVREGFNVPDGFVWRDHPIGVPYPRGDREFRPFGQVVASGQVRMPQERVECVSCHDPHNEAGVDKLLVISNRRSALCLACHIK